MKKKNGMQPVVGSEDFSLTLADPNSNLFYYKAILRNHIQNFLVIIISLSKYVRNGKDSRWTKNWSY